MKSSKAFVETITAYVEGFAQNNPEFAERLKIESKSMEQCCIFILEEVRKSGCCGFTDEEIYGMALHYWDEDDIQVASTKLQGHFVVNHVVELTQEEKDAMKQRALDEVLRQQKALITERDSKPKAKAKADVPFEQLSLF